MLLLLAANAWKRLPDVPDPTGFAGAFAGVSQGSLVVAGGTNFTDKMPWEGGTKKWYDTVYVLDKPDGTWRQNGHLPKPNGYGVSLSTSEGLLIAGGGNASEHYTDVFWLGSKSKLPPLPKPCAFMSGCIWDDVVYIAGGIDTPTSTTALSTFWSLDLKQPGSAWKELPQCPGKPRILACMAAANGAVYLMSGAALKADADGKPVREWLKDAWQFRPNKGWERLPDLPRVAVAAPSPAPIVDSKIVILGGDDGALVNFQPKEKHPGFPRSVQVYDCRSGLWTQGGELPFSSVTTPAVLWHGQVVIPCGEARPGVRSPQVWAAPLD